MKKPQFNETLTKLGTIEQSRQRYKLSRNKLMEYAEKCGAIRRFGRSVRIDIETLDKAINENYRGGDLDE